MWILGLKGLIQFQLREPHKQVGLQHRPKISLQSYPALPTPTSFGHLIIYGQYSLS